MDRMVPEYKYSDPVISLTVKIWKVVNCIYDDGPWANAFFLFLNYCSKLLKILELYVQSLAIKIENCINYKIILKFS